MFSFTELLSVNCVILLFISNWMVNSHPPCGLYGAPPCNFVPAAPGYTPPCARPGTTYCEYVDTYPTYVIKHLVSKWGYESKNLIIDETVENFNSIQIQKQQLNQYFDPSTIFTVPPLNNFGYNYENPTGGGNPSYRNNQNINNRNNNQNNNNNNVLNRFSQPFFVPKANNKESNYLVYTTGSGSVAAAAAGGGGGGIQQQRSQPQYRQQPNFGLNFAGAAKVTQYNPATWLKRYVRDLSSQPITKAFPTLKLNPNLTRQVQHSRDVSLNLGLLNIIGVSGEKEQHGHQNRIKRQSRGREGLCKTDNAFIQPQAALNSKGNWMYVVNEPNTARQLVKAERCASTECSSLCQLPNGYNSRCEQKFVQKRLVALTGNGENLYTDTFWFPSCCICTIASN